MSNDLQNQWDQNWDRSQQPQSPAPNNPLPRLGWHKFLIYFALWAGAVMNIINAAQMFTGTIYMGSADLVYVTYPGLRTADIVYGVLLCVLGFYQIVTRFSLAKFRVRAPKMLNLVYVFAVVLSVVVYNFTAAGLTAVTIADTIPGLFGAILSSCLMIGINTSYYKKRRHLFVNP